MKIFGLEISKYHYDAFLEEITEYLNTSPQPSPGEGEGVKGRSIFTPNPEISLKTLEDREFLELLQKADYLTSDGIGLYLGYQINDSKLPKIVQFLMLPIYVFNILFRRKYIYERYGERICGSDLTNSLLEYSQENKVKIAIIDPYYPHDQGKCKSQETFREKLSTQFPGLGFDFYIEKDNNRAEIFQKIETSGAQILFATLGMKKQEMCIMEGLEACPGIKLGLGIGSSFDYHTGFQKRAPKIFRDVGFEWLYRIFTSPNKLKRLGRIYQALIVFPLKVIFYK